MKNRNTHPEPEKNDTIRGLKALGALGFEDSWIYGAGSWTTLFEPISSQSLGFRVLGGGSIRVQGPRLRSILGFEVSIITVAMIPIIILLLLLLWAFSCFDLVFRPSVLGSVKIPA